MLKHMKPHKCDVPGCKRNEQGFTTLNELNWHKKIVHRLATEHRGFQCKAENCWNKEKIWPRLDNFRQHIERMHQDEDIEDLVNRYDITQLFARCQLKTLDHGWRHQVKRINRISILSRPPRIDWDMAVLLLQVKVRAHPTYRLDRNPRHIHSILHHISTLVTFHLTCT